MSSTPTSVTVPGPAVPARALKIQSRLRMAATWALIKPYWKSETAWRALACSPW